MLIRKEHTENGALLGIWKMDESKEELLQLFPTHLRPKANSHLNTIRSERRSIEWLATRAMLFNLLGKEQIILNRVNGSPYLADEKYRISISHTKEYAAMLLHETAAVGIDIETFSERVVKIAEKFISDKEYIDPSHKVEHQLLHWSAKESLFKLMNEEGIDFKQHLHIEPFIPQISGIMTASETKTAEKRNFTIHYEVHPKYVLTWSIDQ
jgi:4'-phosphopantetheinyl transferase